MSKSLYMGTEHHVGVYSRAQGMFIGYVTGLRKGKWTYKLTLDKTEADRFKMLEAECICDLLYDRSQELGDCDKVFAHGHSEFIEGFASVLF